MRAVSSRSACTSRRRLFRTALVVDRAVGAAAVAGCGKLYRARSRRYRNKILQENMRLKALAEIYTMHSFAQLRNLNFFVKILPTNLQNSENFKFSKISENFRKNLAKF